MIGDHEAKDIIMKAAKTEFAARGYQGARMAVIAESAGVNKALIHYYFKSKEGLYKAVLSTAMGGGEKGTDIDLPVYFGSESLSSSQKLYLIVYIMTMITLKCVDDEMNDIVLWEMAEGGEFMQTIRNEIFGPRESVLKKVIERGIEEGAFSSRYIPLVLMGIGTQTISFRIEKQRRMCKPTMYSLSPAELDTPLFLDYIMEYTFKMVCPDGETYKIPEVPEPVLSYIDGIIDIAKNRGLSSSIVEKLIKIIGE